MKVIHVAFGFAPDPIGGTEVYVSQLARDLSELGLDNLIVAPAKTTHSYTIDKLRVRRFAFNGRPRDLREMYGLGDKKAAAEFARILTEEAPGLVHFHALTPAVSVQLISIVKAQKIPIVLTYHTPTVTCQRGTMLLWGSSFCDGRLDVVRCSGCTLHGLGVNVPIAKALSRMPVSIGSWLGERGLRGGVWTALRTTELIDIRHNTFRTIAANVDRFVAVCDWVRDILLVNDIPTDKIIVSRHGINWTPVVANAQRRSAKIQIAFVGRLERTKGLHVLVSALKLLPDLEIQLDVFGIVQNKSQASYKQELQSSIGDDARISFLDPIASSEVVSRLSDYDFLAVPSQWLETGPLVVLEAFAAKIPVLGCNVGGVGELVRHEVDGLLVAPGSNSINAWTQTLRRVVEDRHLNARLKAGVRPPRRSMDVAHEMLELYKRC